MICRLDRYWRSLTVWVGVFGLAGIALLGSLRQEAHGQGEASKPLPKLYFGSQACATAGCHEKGQVANPPLLCRGDEWDRFKAHDRHGDAYKALTGELGIAILKRLNLGDPQKAKACLACHSVNIEKDAIKHDTFQIGEGVGCVVCHGAHEKWVGAHSLVLSRAAFRILSRDKKETEYGMTDLWDPAKRTALCASCHIGNHAEGKFVTHEMYAAGHPILPGFEVATFSEQMPRHWQLMREKLPEVQKIQGHSASEWEESQLLLVGSAVTLRESMRLLAKQAEYASLKGEMLDWALLDCISCHHDLRLPSWRQEQARLGKPGRVPPKNWPTTLALLAGEWAQSREALGPLKSELFAATQARPFGDPQKVALAANRMADWADRVAKELSGKPLNPTTGPKLGDHLLKLGLTPPTDFDSARQTGWALTLYRAEEMALLGVKRPQWDSFLGEATTRLALKLPFGRSVNPAERNKEILAQQYAFDPENFFRWMQNAPKVWKD